MENVPDGQIVARPGALVRPPECSSLPARALANRAGYSLPYSPMGTTARWP